MAAPLPPLTEQEIRFCEEYVKDRNATRSAYAAGLSSTYDAARKYAHKILKRSDIRRQIANAFRKLRHGLKFEPDRVVRNWMLAATVDPTYFTVNENGLDAAPGVPKEYLRCVKKWKYKTVTRYEQGTGVPITTTESEIEIRDPFGPEQKLMEYHHELEGEGSQAALQLAAAIAGIIAARNADTGGVGPTTTAPRQVPSLTTTAPAAGVEAESGSTDGSTPECGG